MLAVHDLAKRGSPFGETFDILPLSCAILVIWGLMAPFFGGMVVERVVGDSGGSHRGNRGKQVGDHSSDERSETFSLKPTEPRGRRP